ncbi:Alpha/beta hydrolase fold-1 [Tricladium varicosporioides]|nr:Alpha/beta hydrolase fold-1 [Hymenoscyphus varicosporioides]
MTKPTFVFVPGAWHTPSYWDPLINLLEANGYEAIAVSLPSIGGNPATDDFAPDVEKIHKIILELADQGKDIIPVMHSYGGMCGGSAVKGLGKKEREASKLQGGVVRLVYIMAMMDAADVQPAPTGTNVGCPEWMKFDYEAKVVTVSKEDCIRVFYNDISPSIADKMASEILPQSAGVYWSTTSYAPWRKIPTTYVRCTNDQSMGVVLADYYLGIAKSTDDHMIDTIETVDAGHFVMVSQPEWVAGVLERAARENI